MYSTDASFFPPRCLVCTDQYKQWNFCLYEHILVLFHLKVEINMQEKKKEREKKKGEKQPSWAHIYSFFFLRLLCKALRNTPKFGWEIHEISKRHIIFKQKNKTTTTKTWGIHLWDIFKCQGKWRRRLIMLTLCYTIHMQYVLSLPICVYVYMLSMCKFECFFFFPHYCWYSIICAVITIFHVRNTWLIYVYVFPS